MTNCASRESSINMSLPGLTRQSFLVDEQRLPVFALQKALFFQRYIGLAETAVFGGGKAEAFYDGACFQIILDALLQDAVAFAVND